MFSSHTKAAIPAEISLPCASLASPMVRNFAMVISSSSMADFGEA